MIFDVIYGPLVKHKNQQMPGSALGGRDFHFFAIF